jgi:hypothetical protein
VIRLALLLSLLGPWLAAPSALAVDLVGTWHVLAHYKDSAVPNADAERWEDRVWVFQREGDRLRWIDYPLVVFEDESGRFTRLGTNRASRTLRYWTPNDDQLAELERGPQVNSRGSKSKSLRGTDAEGWRSTNAQQRSVGFITYEEHWSIEGLPERPVFTRVDVLGGGAADEAEGRTRWETKQVEASGKELRGSYDRDGTRLGTFEMRKVGRVRNLSTEGPTPNDKQRERVREEMLRQLDPGGGDEESP